MTCSSFFGSVMIFDVVMLTSAHSATDDRIFYREAKTLHEAGQSVCVVGRHLRLEVLEGIHIRPLRGAASRPQRLLLGLTILRIAITLNGRLYIIHDPELIGIALILRLLGKKVVYDAHENLPAQIQQKEWIPKPIRGVVAPAMASVEWAASQVLSGVIAAVPAIAARFPARKTILARNFPTRSALETLAEGPAITQRANLVIYTGGLSRVRGIRELVEAFRQLEGAELWLVGDFDDPTFRQELLARLPNNVQWLGWKTHPEVLKLYRMAKLGAVLLHPTPNHRCALPVKLFEYLGAGLPIIASDFPEYKDLVEGCGMQVDPTNVDEIRNGIKLLLTNDLALTEMSTRARHRVVASCNWQNDGARLVDFCTRLMAPPLAIAGTGLSSSPGPSNSR
jgi:glycosyltransferase involved in cell wall biosynthesis